jgi:hypothetical protein
VIIVLEGPDGAGKTTLARVLQETYGLDYHHEGPPPRDEPVLWHYGRVLDSFRGRRIVLDRLALGERVYGPVYRGRDELGDEGWALFERLTCAVAAVQVLCLPPVDNVLRTWRYEQRDEMYRAGGEEQLIRTYRRYGFLGHTQDFVFDYTRPGELDRLTQFLTRRSWTGLPSGYLGSPQAKLLLVGDQVGDVTKGVDLPFFTTQGSASYLNRALHLAGYTAAELAFVNARNRAGQENVLDPRFRIVALGDQAATVCRRQGVDFVQVAHPQFRKRFHHHRIAEYVADLRRCRP